MSIRFDHVHYRYEERHRSTSGYALSDANLQLEEGRFIVIAGSSGSGKSTLLQMFNGILLPTEGRIRIQDRIIAAGEKLKRANELRRKVGLVFQFPERQLFEVTVRDDLIFGPRNFGMAKNEAIVAAIRVCKLLGLDEEILDKSPFALSGGEQRKVAIGAVLASDPDILALDEPTASLDPWSRAELMDLLAGLCRDKGKTVIVVTHRLEDVLGRADDCAVLSGGRLLFRGTPEALLARPDMMEAAGLMPPPAVRLAALLAGKWGVAPPALYGAKELAAWAAQMIGRRDAGKEGAE